MHFVMNCTQFEELCAKMLQLVENKYVVFKSLNDMQKTFLSFYKWGQRSLSWHVKIYF